MNCAGAPLTSLDDAFAEDVVEVEHAEVGALCVEDDELGDAVGAHEVETWRIIFGRSSPPSSSPN